MVRRKVLQKVKNSWPFKNYCTSRRVIFTKLKRQGQFEKKIYSFKIQNLFSHINISHTTPIHKLSYWYRTTPHYQTPSPSSWHKCMHTHPSITICSKNGLHQMTLLTDHLLNPPPTILTDHIFSTLSAPFLSSHYWLVTLSAFGKVHLWDWRNSSHSDSTRPISALWLSTHCLETSWTIKSFCLNHS